MLELLRAARDDFGQTIVMVTHDPVAAGFADGVGGHGGRAGHGGRDTMIAIIARSLWARKRRLVATLLAVALGVAFLAGTLLLSDTLRANFDRLFTQADGGTNVVLRGATEIGSGNSARTGVDASLLPRVRTVPGVADAQPYLEGYGQLLGRDGKPIGGNGPPTQAANWVGDPALNPYRLVAGHAPRAGDEVVINRGAARTGHLALGMTTTLLTPQPLRVHIVGISTFGTADGFGPGTFTGMTLDAARAHLAGPARPQGPAELTEILVKASPGVPDQPNSRPGCGRCCRPACRPSPARSSPPRTWTTSTAASSASCPPG